MGVELRVRGVSFGVGRAVLFWAIFLLRLLDVSDAVVIFWNPFKKAHGLSADVEKSCAVVVKSRSFTRIIRPAKESTQSPRRRSL